MQLNAATEENFLKAAAHPLIVSLHQFSTAVKQMNF
jgi:hypothetical protein